MRNWLKEPFFALAFLLAPVFLFAQDDFNSFGDGIFDDGANFPVLTGEPPDYTDGGEEAETPQAPQTQGTPKDKNFRFKNRMIEMSLVNTSFDFSNNFVATTDVVRDPVYLLGNINNIKQDPGLIWRDPIVIDMDYFFDGFKFNFGAAVKPLSFNFNWKDKWGFGLDIAHIDITGNVSLSENMVTLSEAGKDKFGVGTAVFVDTGIPLFFYYDDFKIKLRPAVYVPVVYTEPKVTYRFTNVVKKIVTEIDGEEFVELVKGTRYDIDYDMRVYSLVSMEGTDGGMDVIMQRLTDNAWDIPRNNLGYDFRLNVEYPWRYDIDIGVDIVNIPVPFAAAKLYHYTHFTSSVWMDTSELDYLEFVEEGEEGNTKGFEDLKGTAYDYSEEFTTEYKKNKNGKKIYRPFAMVFYAYYRPFEERSLTLIPSLGFSINNLYPQIAAVEGGLSARFNARMANAFITTLGINYNDRRWINSVDFILNFRAVEFDFGLSFQSQNFVRSWQGAGMGVNFGVKLGW